jgi:aconitate hydratase
VPAQFTTAAAQEEERVVNDSFGSRATMTVADRPYQIRRLSALEGVGDISQLPYCIKILLENLLRHEDGRTVTAADIEALAKWPVGSDVPRELPFRPERVLMQDFTGVPAVVDLIALRDTVTKLGGDGTRVNPRIPVELIIDHSVIAEVAGTADAFESNRLLEFARNAERYRLLRWAQQGFDRFAVVPPDTGICHQINLEHLARVVSATDAGEAFPDTLVGTDSHTPMVNGIGVLGWGVGGIEAEAAMLGQPLSVPLPAVVGVRLIGSLSPMVTATDLVLTMAEVLRHHGVVGKFVEFTGPGLTGLRAEHRATLGNMAPEYGATCAISPIDQVTLDYLRMTGRPEAQVALVEAYAKEQGLFHSPGDPDLRFSELITLDLGTVEACLAGPSRPQDRVPLALVRKSFRRTLGALEPSAVAVPAEHQSWQPPSPRDGSCEQASADSFPASDPPATMAGLGGDGDPDPLLHEPAAAAVPTANLERRPRPISVDLAGARVEIDDGHVVIAAITSCTNTSNPDVMVAAGLLARNAVQLGLRSRPWVKTSLAPGSRVVVQYLQRAGLDRPLAELGFDLVGYGCTTCIGNSGPLLPEVSAAIAANHLAVAAVLSGNRNFEGRIHSEVRLNYLASPPLVVAYALAGTLDIDFTTEPIGRATSGKWVWLQELWPSADQIREVVERVVTQAEFRSGYATLYDGDALWASLEMAGGARFRWQPESTYVQPPPFLDGVSRQVAPVEDIQGARCLALLGDSVTTDHISPAGAIPHTGPAGRYLAQLGVPTTQFNSFGARRGNHEVMVRGTFANPRLRNALVPGIDGGFTRHLPGGQVLTIFEAAQLYQQGGVPLIVIAGKDYGSGSSRDWAAKGTRLLGVRVVLAESFERIHRSNLIGMGVLPIQFIGGATVGSLGLTGEEIYEVTGLQAVVDGDASRLRIVADGRELPVRARLDSPTERDHFRHGGILPFTLRELLME